MHDDKKFATRCVHAGQKPDPATGAIMTPIYQTSTYVQPTPGEFVEDYDYSRSANPTRKALERNLAALEDAKHGLAFASGLASLAACVHLLSSGDHVVLSDDVYGGTFRAFDKVFQQFGVTYTRVDMTDPAAVDAAVTPATKMVWTETPSNPLLKIVDIAAVAARAKAVNAVFVVDNTFATPALQRPLALGADIVSHSCTKYIGGHSDLVGGALLVNDDELANRLRFVQNAVGAVPSPFECFLLLRSTKTLHLRMARHCDNAARIADFLADHRTVDRVIYPGRADHPGHAVAAKQMNGGFGGMITATLRGGLPAARTFLENLSVFSLAESLGGVESLVEHPAIMTHSSIEPEIRAQLGIDDGLVRLSVGVEDVEDQLADLERALAAVSAGTVSA